MDSNDSYEYSIKIYERIGKNDIFFKISKIKRNFDANNFPSLPIFGKYKLASKEPKQVNDNSPLIFLEAY